MDAIKSKDPTRTLYTVEFFPEEGKYHYDGHASHAVRLAPEETIARNGKCPTCGKTVTVGVLSRVAKLADRPAGHRPLNAIPFKSMVPLDEIIGEALDLGVSSKKVKQEYDAIISGIGSEFGVLIEATPEELRAVTRPEVVEGITRIRDGRVTIEPGYDGLYGVIKIFDESDRAQFVKTQSSLFT